MTTGLQIHTNDLQSSAMNETALRIQLEQKVPGCGDGIETQSTPGVPDVYGTTVMGMHWVELKMCHNHFLVRTQQRNWHARHTRFARGRNGFWFLVYDVLASMPVLILSQHVVAKCNVDDMSLSGKFRVRINELKHEAVGWPNITKVFTTGMYV